MKLLRNPIVVSLLALAAVALVYWNVVRPMLKGAFGKRAPAVAQTPKLPASQSPKLAAVQTPNPSSPFLPYVGKAPTNSSALTLNLPMVQANASHWVSSPRRDPFHGREQPKTKARQMLSLKGVWRQAGHDLAVINNRLLAQGDTILEFTVDKIEDDQVWVTGPNGREALSFVVPRPQPEMALEAAPGSRE